MHDVLRQAVQLCEVVTRLWGFTAAALWLTLLLEHGRGWLLLLSLPVLLLGVLVMSAPGGDGMACCCPYRLLRADQYGSAAESVSRHL